MNHTVSSFDLLLSSGYLAFARHIGFLHGIEKHALPIEAIVGTSSGALIGSLWAAGIRGQTLSELIAQKAPINYVKLSLNGGLFSLHPMIEFLHQHLPARFEDLPISLAVGVVDAQNQYQLLTQGPLPEAIAASCAVPYLFKAITINGITFKDGGVTDRIGWDAWQAWRPRRSRSQAIVHWVDRTHGKDTDLPPEVTLIRSPRSGAHLWNLGPFTQQVQESSQRTDEALISMFSLVESIGKC